MTTKKNRDLLGKGLAERLYLVRWKVGNRFPRLEPIPFRIADPFHRKIYQALARYVRRIVKQKGKA